MERRNKKVKERGNGEGTLYFSETLQCYVAQYVEPSGKRKTIKQKKNEKVGEFKKESAEYYSQEFKVNNTVEMTDYIITDIQNLPEGSYSTDINNIPKIKFSNKENFKIFIPTNKILSALIWAGSSETNFLFPLPIMAVTAIA